MTFSLNACRIEFVIEMVVFDLGGVLVRICHSWQEAATVAGVNHVLPPEPSVPFPALPAFDAYQVGEMSLDGYLNALGEMLGCDTAQALHVHNSILIGLYDEIDTLLTDLKRRGVTVGCMSNTNAAHWKELRETDRFDAIRKIECAMASHIVGYNKPDPRIFEAFCAEFDVLPDEILYFDDAAINVDTANRLGYVAHRIDPTRETAPQIREILAAERIL